MEPKTQAKRLTKFTLYAYGVFVLILIILVLTHTTTYEKALPSLVLGTGLLPIIWAIFIPKIARSSPEELQDFNRGMSTYGKVQSWYYIIVAIIVLITTFIKSGLVAGLTVLCVLFVFYCIGWIFQVFIRKNLRLN